MKRTTWGPVSGALRQDPCVNMFSTENRARGIRSLSAVAELGLQIQWDSTHDQSAVMDRNSPWRLTLLWRTTIFKVLWQGSLSRIYKASQLNFSTWGYFVRFSHSILTVKLLKPTEKLQHGEFHLYIVKVFSPWGVVKHWNRLLRDVAASSISADSKVNRIILWTTWSSCTCLEQDAAPHDMQMLPFILCYSMIFKLNRHHLNANSALSYHPYKTDPNSSQGLGKLLNVVSLLRKKSNYFFFFHLEDTRKDQAV